MLFFVDSCDVNEISRLSDLGMVDGVTTNPTLVKKSGRNFFEALRDICSIVKGSVSAEVVASKYDEIILEAMKLREIGEQITIKLPMTFDGLKACRYLSDQDIMVNMTLCFSPQQALLAAKAGATYVSPFIGRLDDIGVDGLSVVSDICQIFDNYNDIMTQVLVASIRNVNHIVESAKIGADVATIPPSLFDKLIHHQLTDSGLKDFLKDWAETKQSII
jgi:transaldolase